MTLQSGFPFTPQLGFNATNNGDSRNPIRPSWNPVSSGPVILGHPDMYFNPAAFVVPAAGAYGNVGRDVLEGPGLATFDLSALKDFVLSERVKLQFRSEFFNVLNRTNFSIPNPIVFTASAPSSTAGVMSATSTTSRQIQFGLKLRW